MKNRVIILFISLSILSGCATDGPKSDDPQHFYLKAKEYFDDENYQIAIQKFSEFRAKFPYSTYAAEADLLIADCYFELGQFPEAGLQYRQFVTLHPENSKKEYALYRTGASLWNQAPTASNREQEYTEEALQEWGEYLEKYPKGEFADKVKDFIKQGRIRLAESLEFIGDYYYKKEVWHSCAYVFMKLAERFPEFEEKKKRALLTAASALEKSLAQLNETNKNSNIFYKDLGKEGMAKRIEELKTLAGKS